MNLSAVVEGQGQAVSVETTICRCFDAEVLVPPQLLRGYL